MIPYGRQSISEDDIAAVEAVLRSDWLTQGPTVPSFEAAVAAFCGARHGVAVNSATSALHLACLALDLGPGDWLWTSPITFVASANCGLYCGARVDFVDIDPATGNMDPEKLESKLRQAQAAGRLPKAVVPVHFTGRPAPMAEIRALADRFGFRIIEDASHALGARYQGMPVGNCRHSDITVFSFHPVKIITSGEGGLALTNDTKLARRMARLRSHGITREAEEMTGPPEGAWIYEQTELGFNYRMTDIQAALGLSQFNRLDHFISWRRNLARRYRLLLESLPLDCPPPSEDSSWHLYVIQLRNPDQRKPLFDGLRAAGIGVQVHYIPVHLQPAYSRLGFRPGDFPLAEDYYRRAISLPIYPDLDSGAQEFIATTLESQIP